MAGRKVFTSGEILTAADVNSFLMNQVVAVFADSTARSSAIPTPTEGMVTYVEDSNRVEVYDGSAFGPIGGILQVVNATHSTLVTVASTTLADTNLEATITPSSASSKVLVLVSQHMGVSRSATNINGRLALLRDSTSIFDNLNAISNSMVGLSTTNLRLLVPIILLDEPATTSPVTYKTQIAVNTTADSGLANAQLNNQKSNITLLEVAV